jgi:hypothetical protein
MTNSKHLTIPAYAIACLLILFPLLDTALSVFPPRFGEVAWRFGATGLFSRALMTPLLGLLLAFAVALIRDQRKMQRAVAVVSAVVAVVIIGAVGLFVLDAVQMRSQVRPQAKTAFDIASLVALGKFVLGLMILVAFTISGWKASRRDATARVRVKDKVEAPAGVLIGQR